MEKLVPKLRFPEFKGNWEKSVLGELSSFISKGTTPKQFTNEGINFVKIESLNGINIIKEKCVFIDETTHYSELKRSILEENDILFAIAGATVGKIGIVRKEILPANTNQALAIIRLKNKDLVNFILFILDSVKMKKYIQESISVGAQPNLNLQQINNFDFFVPSDLEQQKIASFLTSVDERLTLLAQQKEKLELYKKGVMQQIFAQKLRFKDENGNTYPDWEEKKLGEIFNNKGGTSLENYQDSKGSHKFISIGNYSKDGKYIDNGQRINLNYKSKEKLLDKDNLVMVLNDKTKSGDIIGSSILIDENDKYIYNQRSERLICKKMINPLFAWHLLNSKIVRKKIFSVSQGGTQIYVNFPSVKQLNLNIPCLEEQQKIASFLSAIDVQIEGVSKKIEQTKLFKKGLLQQMFV